MKIACCAYQRRGDQIIIKIYGANNDSFGASPCNDNQDRGYQEKEGHDLNSRRNTSIHDPCTDGRKPGNVCDASNLEQPIYRDLKEDVHKNQGVISRNVEKTRETKMRDF